ncbi:MAG: adenosine deaminase [Gammaproteobacteria bacterium]|nr:adenosine deaminase [Gammaproteobacteria bacterium]
MRQFAFAIWLLFTCAWSLGHADVQDHFETLKAKPRALYTFLKDMPKGGELHYHYDGSVYAETMLQLGIKSNLCINPSAMCAQFCQPHSADKSVKTVLKNSTLFQKTVHTWSMQDFVPRTASGHDHFFAIFPKIGAFYQYLKGPLLAAILQKAAAQHELYLEIIAFGFPEEDEYAKLIRKTPTLAQKRAVLIANPAFQRRVQHMIDDSATFLPQAHTALHCASQPQQAACHIKVNFQAYVRRVQSIDSVFAQALAGFMAAEHSPTIVGINLVDIEDSPVAQRDYVAQMEIFSFLHQQYPNVHIALHAGELFPKNIAHHKVIAPIRDAIMIGHAERIGHGVDIQDEPNPVALAEMMANKNIAVETNLTSNRWVLGVKGKQHPLKFYLQHHVPVVLSTDDEGILRTTLSREYFNAVVQHDLDYDTLKQINRNALTYGFMPGQSLWQNPDQAIAVKECDMPNSSSCQNFIKRSPKATLQWQLEQDLARFEKQWYGRPMHP